MESEIREAQQTDAALRGLGELAGQLPAAHEVLAREYVALTSQVKAAEKELKLAETQRLAAVRKATSEGLQLVERRCSARDVDLAAANAELELLEDKKRRIWERLA